MPFPIPSPLSSWISLILTFLLQDFSQIYFSQLSPTLHCFPCYIHTTACVHTHAHTEKHMPLSSFLQYFPLTSTFWDKFRKTLLYLFHWKGLGSLRSSLPSPLSSVFDSLHPLPPPTEGRDSWQCLIVILNFTRFINRNSFHIRSVVQNMIVLWISMLDQVCIQPQIPYPEAFSYIS